MNDLISVYIPTKNRLNTLKKAIDSVLSQTYKNFELIIVDDASDDFTYEYLQSLKDTRIRIYRNDISKGAPFCRNIAIKNAKGKYITGLDDDDEFLENRLEELYKNYNENYAFVFSDYYIKSKSSKFLKKTWSNKYLYLNQLYINGNIVGNQVFTTKDKLLSIGLFDENLKAAQDYDVWLRLLKKYKIALHISKPLYIVNILENSITNSNNRIKGYRQLFLKHKTNMPLEAKKFHISSYLVSKNVKFFRLIKFLPCNYRGMVVLIKYLKKVFI